MISGKYLQCPNWNSKLKVILLKYPNPPGIGHSTYIIWWLWPHNLINTVEKNNPQMNFEFSTCFWNFWNNTFSQWLELPNYLGINFFKLFSKSYNNRNSFHFFNNLFFPAFYRIGFKRFPSSCLSCLVFLISWQIFEENYTWF